MWFVLGVLWDRKVCIVCGIAIMTKSMDGFEVVSWERIHTFFMIDIQDENRDESRQVRVEINFVDIRYIYIKNSGQ